MFAPSENASKALRDAYVRLPDFTQAEGLKRSGFLFFHPLR
jgi:hypothetical protein